jgi:hypothetical protein
MTRRHRPLDVFMIRQQIRVIPRRSRYRCNRCRVLVEDREWGRHMAECMPELREQHFTKVD